MEVGPNLFEKHPKNVRKRVIFECLSGRLARKVHVFYRPSE